MAKDGMSRVLRIIGVALAVLAVYMVIASLSYLFSWQTDQSVQTFSDTNSAQNAAGYVGNKLGTLLVGRLFGLGAFILVAAIWAPAMRLTFGPRSYSILKTIVMSLSGTLLLSFILAFISQLLGFENAFGGGLGGDCGSFAISYSRELFGSISTFLALLALLVVWLIFASRKFSRWFVSLGQSKQARKKSRKDKKESRKARKQQAREEKTATQTGSQTENGEESVSSGAGVDIPPSSSGLYDGLDYGDSAPVGTPPAAEERGDKPTDSSDEGALVVNREGETPLTNVEELTHEEELIPIDIHDELKFYQFPPLSLLEEHDSTRKQVSQDELQRNNLKIRSALATYKIDVTKVEAIVGPTVTLYKVYQAPGVRISSIKKLQDDIAMQLGASKGVRVVSLTDSVGIEVANDHPSIVPLRAILGDDNFRNSEADLPVAIGYTITCEAKVFDLADAPHLLVAGATKQGKSVGLNVLIASLLYSKHPSELKFVFIDPKKVEFTAYAKLIKHYLAVLPTSVSDEDEFNNAIAKDPKPADQILRSLCIEMDERYELLSKAMVNNVKPYNEKFKSRLLHPKNGHKYLPYIVVVIDEFADLTMSVGSTGESKTLSRSISTSIVRLAQKGRAAGIHLVIATQRPSVDVITGIIKANFPTRIAFRVLAMQDSRTILDSPGAEKLIGRGDMIYYSGVEMTRVQCAFISNDEINAITSFIGSQLGWKKNYNTPYYLPAPDPDSSDEGVGSIDMKNLDERFEEAAKLVVVSQKGSTSDLQRKLGMGYAKAGRVMDQLEAAGIVGPQEGSKPRQILVSDLAELQGILDAYMKR